MITAMIFTTVKSEHLKEFEIIIPTLTKAARERSGCITYKFNQRAGFPQEFVLYEQWESQPALDAHIKGLSEFFGPPKIGELLPEKLLDMYEKVDPVFYEVID